MSEMYTRRDAYRILANKNNTKFRVERLTLSGTVFSAVWFGLRSQREPYYEWKLVETGDRDVLYDLNTLQEAEELIVDRIAYWQAKQDRLVNSSEWSVVQPVKGERTKEGAGHGV